MRDAQVHYQEVIKMSIQVQVKNVYGNELVYPICSTAMKFANLLRTKTFTTHHVESIKALGYEFEIVQVKAVL